MYCTGHINEFTPDKLADIEKRMMPTRYGHGSTLGFLAVGEKLMDVYQRDIATLESLNITTVQIADRLTQIIEKFFRKEQLVYPHYPHYSPLVKQVHEKQLQTIDAKILDKPVEFAYPGRIFSLKNTRFHTMIENRYLVTGSEYWGFQFCPFTGVLSENPMYSRKHHGGGWDICIYDTTAHKYIVFNNLLIHLIRHHSFFEGSVFSRLDPFTVINLLDLKPGVSYDPGYKSMNILQEIKPGGELIKLKDNCGNRESTEFKINYETRIQKNSPEIVYDDKPYLYVDIYGINNEDIYIEFEFCDAKCKIDLNRCYYKDIAKYHNDGQYPVLKFQLATDNYVPIEEELCI